MRSFVYTAVLLYSVCSVCIDSYGFLGVSFRGPSILMPSFLVPSFRVSRSRFLEMRAKKNAIGISPGNGNIYYPRGENQKQYVDLLENSNTTIVVGTGPAGCGKTLFACSAAINALRCGDVDRIVITRPIISVDDEEMGFLPGSLVQKMDPWTRPIFDVFGEFYSKTQLQSMVQNGVIEISPLAYMRGRTFKRAFIIADEMQNSSPNQMLMMLTRIGDRSKLVVTGDELQSDRSGMNGLGDLIVKLRDTSLDTTCETIRMVCLGNVDVQRNPVVKQILDIYQPATKVSTKPSTKNVVKPDVKNAVKPAVKPAVKVEAKNVVKPAVKPVVKVTDNDAALIPKQHIRPTIFDN